MQPESNESSSYTSHSATPEPSLASQYGFPLPEHLHPADQRSESAGSSDDGNAADDDDVELQEQLRGLNVSDNGQTKPKPSFSRISEYENALSPSPPRKHSEGPSFKVIKKKGNRLDGVQLDQFPNGKSRNQTRPVGLLSHLLTFRRGLDSHTFASARRFALSSVPRLKTLLQLGHHTSCLAHCILSLLPWSRRDRYTEPCESSNLRPRNPRTASF